MNVNKIQQLKELLELLRDHVERGCDNRDNVMPFDAEHNNETANMGLPAQILEACVSVMFCADRIYESVCSNRGQRLKFSELCQASTGFPQSSVLLLHLTTTSTASSSVRRRSSVSAAVEHVQRLSADDGRKLGVPLVHQ